MSDKCKWCGRAIELVNGRWVDRDHPEGPPISLCDGKGPERHEPAEPASPSAPEAPCSCAVPTYRWDHDMCSVCSGVIGQRVPAAPATPQPMNSMDAASPSLLMAQGETIDGLRYQLTAALAEAARLKEQLDRPCPAHEFCLDSDQAIQKRAEEKAHLASLQAELSASQQKMDALLNSMRSVNRVSSPGSRTFDEMMRDMNSVCDIARAAIALAEERATK